MYPRICPQKAASLKIDGSNLSWEDFNASDDRCFKDPPASTLQRLLHLRPPPRALGTARLAAVRFPATSFSPFSLSFFLAVFPHTRPPRLSLSLSLLPAPETGLTTRRPRRGSPLRRAGQRFPARRRRGKRRSPARRRRESSADAAARPGSARGGEPAPARPDAAAERRGAMQVAGLQRFLLPSLPSPTPKS